MSNEPNPDPDTFSLLCQRQMVKVDSNIHHLNRLRSSLKSGYFEKIFTSSDFEPKYDQVLEIQPINSEVFPIIVELIHGKKLLDDVLKTDNYFPLLETMHELEMEIDLETVRNFIHEHLMSYPPQEAKIFELYQFIKTTSESECLLKVVFEYISRHLTTVRNHEIFPSLLLDHLIQIIKNVEYPNEDIRYEIVQMCTDWLCHDFENRLPHMATLLNSIKPTFHQKGKDDESNSALSNRLPKTSINEQSKQNIAKCVFAMLAFGEVSDPSVFGKNQYCNCGGYDSDYYYYNSYYSDEPRDCNPYTRNKQSKNFSTTTEEKKLEKFLKNGDLYDITVRVGEKTYKLHRSLLELKSGYFADIFRAEYAEAVVKSDGKLTYPSKIEEYLLSDEIDPVAFDKVIDYIYFDRTPNGTDIAVFKTANILKIDDLLEICKSCLTNYADRVGSQNVIELLNYTYSRIQHHDLFTVHLCKHLRDKWPEIENMSQFCSISFEMLAETIKSSRFRLDDPNVILDICSKWIFHDVGNRYHLLPQIAQTINPFFVVNCDKFETENITDLENWSQQMVRDKLWELLSSISYMLPVEESENKITKKLEEIPLFITSSKDEEEIVVLNADLDCIASFEFPGLREFSMHDTSTTMINNNLFIFCKSENPTFLAYNLSLKKCFVLGDGLKRLTKGRLIYRYSHTLLNCNNEIYCLSNNGLVMKFLMQLNRWIILSNKHEENKGVRFTSDGKMLYRIRKISEEIRYSSSYVLEGYDFEKKSWHSVPGSSQLNNVIPSISQLTVFNGCDFAASTFAGIYLFDRETKTWRECNFPQKLWKNGDDVIFAHCEDKMFLLIDKKLYNFTPSNGKAQLRKELPLKYASSEYSGHSYGNIAFIYRPSVSTE